jgi:hypothetical protein
MGTGFCGAAGAVDDSQDEALLNVNDVAGAAAAAGCDHEQMPALESSSKPKTHSAEAEPKVPTMSSSPSR